MHVAAEHLEAVAGAPEALALAHAHPPSRQQLAVCIQVVQPRALQVTAAVVYIECALNAVQQEYTASCSEWLCMWLTCNLGWAEVNCMHKSV